MKSLLLLLFSIVLYSCSTDGLVPCDGDGAEGTVCREYRYSNDLSEGYVEFAHQADTLKIADFFDDGLTLRKTRIERFVNGQTVSITEQFPGTTTRVQTWHYNEMDSLWIIVHGANDSTLEISYDNGKRISERYMSNGELNRSTQYRYYQDDGKLYRRYFYDSADSLIRYETYEYFSSGQRRISFHHADHEPIGRRVFTFSGAGLLISTEFTDADGSVTEREDYTYSMDKLLERTGIRAGTTTKSVFLYY